MQAFFSFDYGRRLLSGKEEHRAEEPCAPAEDFFVLQEQ
jgi:hypothetical protein